MRQGLYLIICKKWGKECIYYLQHLYLKIKQKKHMKNFIEKNFTIIVLVIALIGFFKSCGDGRELSKMRKEIESIKDSTYTKAELNKELKIMGLETEKRMIQATDRKLLDVQRQTQIEEEIKLLKK
jgi:signal transduction histidine kinase